MLECLKLRRSLPSLQKRKVDNRATAWQARAHDHTHSGNDRNTTRRVCNKVRRDWAGRKDRELGCVLREFGPDEVVARHRGMEFLKKDMMRLQGGWLNNKIIDFYLELLKLRNNRQRETNPLLAHCFFSFSFVES